MAFWTSKWEWKLKILWVGHWSPILWGVTHHYLNDTLNYIILYMYYRKLAMSSTSISNFIPEEVYWLTFGQNHWFLQNLAKLWTVITKTSWYYLFQFLRFADISRFPKFSPKVTILSQFSASPIIIINI